MLQYLKGVWKKYSFFLFVCVLSLRLDAEVVRFGHIDVDDGLPYNSIRAIGQDTRGFMWFGSELGLAKFEGYQLKKYLANPDEKYSLASSYVRSITIGRDENMWIGGEGGLNQYNRSKDNFTVFKHQQNNDNSLSSNSVFDTSYDGKNILWVATDFGLNRLDLTNFSFTHFFHSSQDQNTIPHNKVRVLMKAHDGTLWIGGNSGLSYFDQEKQVIIRVNIKDNEQPTILTISQDKSGTIWLGTIGGLFKYEPFTQLASKIIFKKKISYVLASLVDSENNLWIGTYFHGLFRIAPGGEIINITTDNSIADSLSDNSVLSLFQDLSGIIWVGTYNSGLDYFDPKSIRFGTQNNSLNSISCMNTSDIRSAHFINQNEMLLGTLSGLIRVNNAKNNCTLFASEDKKPKTISHNEVFVITKESEHQFWIGTAKGFDLFDSNTGLFKRFGEEINNIGVHKILNFEKYLVIGSDQGLYRFDKKSKKITPVGTSETIFQKAQIHNTIEDRKGRIFAASQEGLLEIDSELQNVKFVSDEKGSAITGIVHSLTIDDNGKIYYTVVEKGFFELDVNTKKVNNIGARLGLKSKEGLIGLYRDDFDNLWLATINQGLFQIDKSRNRLKNFSVSDGLHSELFNFGSFAKSPDGRILFGGKSGFNLFHPEKIETNKTPPIVSLTQLKRFGKTVIPHQDYNGLKIDQHISDLKELHLTHRDTVFGLDFVAAHYVAPDKTTYTYKLDGFDPNWTTTNSQNRGVTYNNLDPGEYTFRLKAQTKSGVWSENDVALKIIISPAPWLTWWAYTIYLVSTILAIVIFIKKRTQVLEARALHLQDTVDERTKELIQEKSKVEQLLSRKNEEFANVSHEFRTPLTLILGPLAQVLKTNKNVDEINRLNIVQRNGYRLLRMVDQLLNLETFRVKSITQKLPQASGKIIRLLAEAFVDLAKEKGIGLEIGKIEEVNFIFTNDALEKIVVNLLSNAIKYTPSGGKIQIHTARTPGNELLIQIEDTGIGIPANRIDSVFERYTRVLNENSEQITGAGIGLALVKDLVEAHNGNIALESEVGVGTKAKVVLPITEEVDMSEVKTHANQEIIAMELMGITNQTTTSSEEIESHGLEANGDKPSVLVIEDNQDMRNYIVERIKEDYLIFTAKDGVQGVNLAISEVPDLIISDIMMPNKDGYQLTNELRHNPITDHIPIILLTARNDRESRLKAWYEQADEYLTKPFDAEELRIRLNNLLGIRNILKKRFSELAFQAKSLYSQTTNLLSENSPSVEDFRTSMQEKFITQLNSVLEKYYVDSSTSVALIASKLAMSERQFLRKSKSIVDMTPIDYLRRYRIEKGRELLEQGKSASYATIEVGFTSQSYFGQCFRAQYGVSPSVYKKAHALQS